MVDSVSPPYSGEELLYRKTLYLVVLPRLGLLPLDTLTLSVVVGVQR